MFKPKYSLTNKQAIVVENNSYKIIESKLKIFLDIVANTVG